MLIHLFRPKPQKLARHLKIFVLALAMVPVFFSLFPAWVQAQTCGAVGYSAVPIAGSLTNGDQQNTYYILVSFPTAMSVTAIQVYNTDTGTPNLNLELGIYDDNGSATTPAPTTLLASVGYDDPSNSSLTPQTIVFSSPVSFNAGNKWLAIGTYSSSVNLVLSQTNGEAVTDGYTLSDMLSPVSGYNNLVSGAGPELAALGCQISPIPTPTVTPTVTATPTITVTATPTLPASSFNVTQSVFSSSCTQGGLILFTYDYSAVNTTNFIITATIPTNTTLVEYGQPGIGSDNGTTGGSVVSWDIGNVGEPVTDVVSMLVRVNSAGVPNGTQIIGAGDYGSGNANVPTNAVTSVVGPNFQISDSQSPATGTNVGSAVTYTLSWKFGGLDLSFFDYYDNDVGSSPVSGYDGTVYDPAGSGTWTLVTGTNGNKYIQGDVTTGSGYLLRSAPPVTLTENFEVAGTVQLETSTSAGMVVALDQAGQNGYVVDISSSPAPGLISIGRITGGSVATITNQTSPVSILAGNWYLLDAGVFPNGSGGVTLFSKVWQRGQTQPANFAVSFVDNSPPSGSATLVGWQVNAGGFSYYDNLELYLPNGAVNPVVYDTIPAGITYQGATPVATTTPFLIWNIPSGVSEPATVNGGAGTITWSGIVSSCEGGAITNQAAIDSSTVPQVLSNSVTLQVTCPPTSTVTPTVTNSPTLTTTLTATFTATNTGTHTATNTATPTATITATNTVTNTFIFTQTASKTATNTATITVTGTATSTDTNTKTTTATRTPTQTPTITVTSTATSTGTNTGTPTETNTSTNSATLTDTQTATNTFTNTPTPTSTFTLTNTPTNSSTFTPTNSPTNSFTPTNTLTRTSTSSPTSSLTPTPTFTPTLTPTQTYTHTITFTATITNTPTLTPTFTVTGSVTATPTPNAALYLDENFFNPSKPLGMEVRVDTAGEVKILIYNMAGEEVEKLADQQLSPGNYRFSWDGLNSSGVLVGNAVYFVIVQQPSGNTIKKVIVLR